MNKQIPISLASLVALMFIAGFGDSAYSQTQQGAVEVSNHASLPQPDLVIDKKNYREFEKSGLHLFPGQIVRDQSRSSFDLSTVRHSSVARSNIIYKRSLYRARQSGTTGLVKIEAGPVIPFYGLWALSALSREHTFSATVDLNSPPANGQLSQR